MTDTSSIVDRCFQFVEHATAGASKSWFDSGVAEHIHGMHLQDHADIVYSAYLLGKGERLSGSSAQAYQAILANTPLYGRPINSASRGAPPNAHLTAYLLGAARLLEDLGKAPMERALFVGWDVDRIIDAHSVPRWPRAWTHHSWRVSHWIGGGPSILLQLARSGRHAEITEDCVYGVLNATKKRIIDKSSGLLRPYRSALLHKIFNAAYSIRHNPDIGEVGGVVHLLWIFHALGIDYVARESLFKKAMLHLERAPFMEKMPYCLDFDIVQLARTARGKDLELNAKLKRRSERLSRNIADFFRSTIPAGYTLHKLPGALATLHECALTCEMETVPGLDTAPIDIIKRAYWI